MNDWQAESSAPEWQSHPQDAGYDVSMDGLEYDQVYDYSKGPTFEQPHDPAHSYQPQGQHHAHQHAHMAPTSTSLGPQPELHSHLAPYAAVHTHHHTATTMTPTRAHVIMQPPYHAPRPNPAPVQHHIVTHTSAPHQGTPADHGSTLHPRNHPGHLGHVPGKGNGKGKAKGKGKAPDPARPTVPLVAAKAVPQQPPQATTLRISPHPILTHRLLSHHHPKKTQSQSPPLTGYRPTCSGSPRR